MKIFVIKISLVFIGITVVLLIFLGLRSIDGDGTAPSYSFLAGRNPTACKDGKTPNVDKLYTYSFEADFNDVCLNAKAELISAGFVDRTLPANKFREHRYWLKNSFPRGPVRIVIHNNHEYIEKYSAVGPRDGCIVVEIAYWRDWGLY